MRITHGMIYDASQTRLGHLVEDFNAVNRQIVTGKKINRLSDDPVGISHVIDLRSSLSNLDQMTKNINTADAWLDGAETSIGAIKNLVDDAKVLAISMNNGIISASDRTNAANQVQEMLNQLLDLANTRVNGQYLFGGTKTDIKPFSFNDPANPTAVVYSGNDDAFTLKTGKDSNMVVGYAGEDFFDSPVLTVDRSNNQVDFAEQITPAAFGAEITATITPGAYSRDGLAAAIGEAMTQASAASGNNITYQVSYDPAAKSFTIQDDGAVANSEVRLLGQTGTNSPQSIAPDLGFDIQDQDSPPAVTSDQPVDWGLFNALFDFKQSLQSSDGDGIERSMTHLDTHFNRMVDAVSRIGYKGISLEIKTTVIQDLKLNYQAQKAEIEEVDIIEAITRLQAKENAYQAALASTSRVMNLSLVDYL